MLCVGSFPFTRVFMKLEGIILHGSPQLAPRSLYDAFTYTSSLTFMICAPEYILIACSGNEATGEGIT